MTQNIIESVDVGSGLSKIGKIFMLYLPAKRPCSKRKTEKWLSTGHTAGTCTLAF